MSKQYNFYKEEDFCQYNKKLGSSKDLSVPIVMKDIKRIDDLKRFSKVLMICIKNLKLKIIQVF
jgi:hypothetical protein